MKKISLCLLAVLALASCQKNEMIAEVGGPEIAFENASVDNATRAAVDPSTTTASIDEFAVWGFMDEPAGTVFDNEVVTKSGSAWTYANTQYWLANHDYYFAAVSPANHSDVVVNTASANVLGLGNIAFTNTAGDVDLIYAATTVSTQDGKDLSAMPKVGLSFNHLLSKVKFTFTNGFDNPNTTIVINDVKMTAPLKADINLNVENWWNPAGWANYAETTTLYFGDIVENPEASEIASRIPAGTSWECSDERLTIPAGETQVYDITFDVTLYNGDVVALERATLKSKITGAVLEMGKAYNFQAEINASNITGEEGEDLYPIEFEVIEVKEWDEVTDFTTELQETSVAAGETLTLFADAVTPETFLVAGTLDGAGNTLTLTEGTEDFFTANTLRLIETTGAATIKNLYIDGNNATYTNSVDTYGIRGIFLTEATGEDAVLIDNVTIENVTYTLNDDAAVKNLVVVNSALEGWTSYNPGTTAQFQNVAFSTGTYGTLRPYGTTTLTDCSFDNGYNLRLDKLQGYLYVNGVIEGNGANVTVDNERFDNGIIRPVGNTTITDLTITGGVGYKTADGKGLRAIFINDPGIYNFDGVTIEDVTYAINVNTTKPVTLSVKNSTLEGWTSFGESTTATFEAVEFTAGEYARVRPYGTTVFTNCSFVDGFSVDLTYLAAGETVTFENCTYNGAPLTDANVITSEDGETMEGTYSIK